MAADSHRIVARWLGGLLLLCAAPLWAADPFTELEIDRPKTRMEAPGFTLNSLAGDRVSLADFRGKVVLLNFWATWCGSCRQEMPAMERLWNRYRDQGFAILAVSVDRGDPRQVDEFVEKLGLSYPIVRDPQALARRQYEISVLPMSYLIGRDGKLSGRIIGERQWDSDAARRLVEVLLVQR